MVDVLLDLAFKLIFYKGPNKHVTQIGTNVGMEVLLEAAVILDKVVWHVPLIKPPKLRIAGIEVSANFLELMEDRFGGIFQFSGTYSCTNWVLLQAGASN